MTATAAPEEIQDVGSAVTVVTREEIERNGWRTVAGRPAVRSRSERRPVRRARRADVGLSARRELHPHSRPCRRCPRELAVLPGLRLLAAVDRERGAHRGRARAVLRSLWIRVDRRSRPDLHAAGRRQALRKGFRRGGERGSAGAGRFRDRGQRAAFGIAASARHREEDGDRGNDDWRERSGSVRLEGHFGETQVALEGSIADGDLGLPGPGRRRNSGQSLLAPGGARHAARLVSPGGRPLLDRHARLDPIAAVLRQPLLSVADGRADSRSPARRLLLGGCPPRHGLRGVAAVEGRGLFELRRQPRR